MSVSGNAKTTLTNAVANNGTFTVAYPSGTTQASLLGSTGGAVALDDRDVWKEADGDVAFTYGASTITVTNSSGFTWPAGSAVLLSFGRRDDAAGRYNTDIKVAYVASIATPASATAADCATKINELITALKAAGVLK